MKKTFCAILLFSVVCVVAQDKLVLDSLRTELQHADNDYQKALFMHKIALLVGVDSIRKAIELEKQALHYTGKEEAGKKLMIDIKNNMGFLYYAINDYQQSIHSFKTALDLLRERDDKVKVVKILNNLGVIHQILGMYDEALEYFFESLDVKESLFDTLGMARTMNNIGVIYKNLNRYDESFKFTTRAMHIYSNTGSKKDLADVYNNLGTIYEGRNKIDTALTYYQKSMEIKEKIKDLPGRANTYNNIGSVYLRKKQYDSAYSNFLKSLSIRKEINDSLGLAYSYENLGRFYFVKNEYQNAIKYVNKSLMISVRKGFLERMQRNYAFLSRIYDSLGNTDYAYEYFKLYEIYKDSVIRQENQDKLSNLAIKYKTEQLERDKEMLARQYEIQRNKRITVLVLLILLSIVFVLAILIIYSRFRLKKKANRALAAKNIQISKKQGELQKTLKELNESEEKYRTLVDKLQEGIFLIQDKKLIFVNQAFTDIVGYSPEELYQKEMTSLIAPYHKAVVLQNYEKRIKGGSVPARYEFDVITKNDEIKHIMLNTGVINYKGKPTSIGSIVDISARKKMEDKLRQSEKKLKDLNASKDKFFNIIAHDLRHPFNAIISFVDLLVNEYDTLSEEEKITCLKDMGEAAFNTSRLIENLLQWSRTQTGKIRFQPESLDLKKTIEEVILLQKPHAKNKSIRITEQLKNTGMVWADRNMLDTILRNLISNAIKFTNFDGKITVMTECQETDCKICIEDNGIGIPEENISKLFDIEQQVNRKGTEKESGTGLGLILCKEFVEVHKGRIWAESQLNKGSKFCFTLPKKRRK